MTRLLALVGLAVLLVVNPLSAQFAAAPGVMVRADGSVILDAFAFLPPTGGSAANLAAPTRVVFGLTIRGDTLVCRETVTGSTCKTVAQLFGEHPPVALRTLPVAPSMAVRCSKADADGHCLALDGP